MSRLTEDIGGQLSPASENEMTLTQKAAAAKAGMRRYRREYITTMLIYNNIDPNTVDMNEILDGEVPEWLQELKKPTSEMITKIIFEREDLPSHYKYFLLTSGLLIKLDNEELTAYRFNEKLRCWNDDSVLFIEYEYGNLMGELIDFDDSYPCNECQKSLVSIK